MLGHGAPEEADMDRGNQRYVVAIIPPILSAHCSTSLPLVLALLLLRPSNYRSMP